MLQFWLNATRTLPTAEFTSRVDRALITSGWTTNAEQGSVATSTLIVDDPNGDWDVTGHREIYMTESEATNTRIYTGLVADRKITRMNPAVSTARKWEITLTDINTILHRPIFHASADNRAAETDVHRVQAVSTYLADANTSLVSTATPVDMDAADYRGQYLSDAIDDCAQQSGKNYYLRDGKATQHWLVYNDSSASTLTSTLRISNVLADVDTNITWAASADTELVRDPQRVYSGIWMPYNGGAVYRSSNATATNFSIRDTVSQAVNVKTASKANARADRMLDDIDSEEDVITTTIWVTAAHVNDAMAGDLISVKFSHLPGYESFTSMRILNRTVLPLIPNDNQPYEYQITYTLGSLGASTPAGSCATSVAAATITGTVDLYPIGSGVPVSLGTGAAGTDDAMQVYFMSYSGPNMGLGGCTLAVGGGWTLLDKEDANGSSIWVAIGYLKQGTIAVPPNMTVTAMCTGGGPAEVPAIATAFHSSGSAPVQQSAFTGSGNAVLPGAPTVGNVLYCASIGSTSAQDTGPWIADGGTIMYGPTGYGVGVYVTIGLRCVTSSDTTTIRVPSGSHANVNIVSEWLP